MLKTRRCLFILFLFGMFMVRFSRRGDDVEGLKVLQRIPSFLSKKIVSSLIIGQSGLTEEKRTIF